MVWKWESAVRFRAVMEDLCREAARGASLCAAAEGGDRAAVVEQVICSLEAGLCDIAAQVTTSEDPPSLEASMQLVAQMAPCVRDEWSEDCVLQPALLQYAIVRALNGSPATRAFMQLLWQRGLVSASKNVDAFLRCLARLHLGFKPCCPRDFVQHHGALVRVLEDMCSTPHDPNCRMHVLSAARILLEEMGRSFDGDMVPAYLARPLINLATSLASHDMHGAVRVSALEALNHVREPFASAVIPVFWKRIDDKHASVRSKAVILLLDALQPEAVACSQLRHLLLRGWCMADSSEPCRRATRDFFHAFVRSRRSQACITRTLVDLGVASDIMDPRKNGLRVWGSLIDGEAARYFIESLSSEGNCSMSSPQAGESSGSDH